MAETKITYGADTAIAITLTGPLTTGAFRSSANFDNATSLYMDVLVGGMIGSAGTSWAAGESVDIYVMANYSDTTTDIGGARDGAYALGDGAQVADTDFILANCTLMKALAYMEHPQRIWTITGGQ